MSQVLQVPYIDVVLHYFMEPPTLSEQEIAGIRVFVEKFVHLSPTDRNELLVLAQTMPDAQHSESKK